MQCGLNNHPQSMIYNNEAEIAKIEHRATMYSSLGSLPCGRCFTYANNIKDLFAILGEVV